jgi:hypothetical protein
MGEQDGSGVGAEVEEMKLVDDVRSAWKWISVQSMALGLAIQGAWEVIPSDLKAGFSEKHVRWTAMVLLVIGIIGRLVKQEKP